MIVATAGHVDHGKTTLIRALTGVHTAHLPEERKRGMTIDLGFAALALPQGNHIGFIDVPGHERFTRNMLAGITGVDFALLIVAADDGIKPQTREHLEILDLLDVGAGVVALTKIDRVDGARLADVSASVVELLAGTTLSGAPIFPISAADNSGVPALREHLIAQAAKPAKRRPGAMFRLPIDRSFVADGAGLVVTGTVAAGSVALGDRLELMPAGNSLRVRGLHTHHNAVASVAAGERCALNIVAGELDRSQLGRGNWLVAPGIAVATLRVDVRLKPAAGALPKDGTRLQFCHGAGSTHGRLIVLWGAAGQAFAQIVLDEPVHALTRDAFILRDADGRRTLAGGVVLDPFPPIRGRRRPERIAMLSALDQADAGDALAQLSPLMQNGLELGQFAQAWNIRPESAQALWKSAGLVLFEDRGYDAALWRRSREAFVAGAARFHLAHPDSFGPLAAQLLRGDSVAGQLPFRRTILESLIRDRELVREGAQVRRPTHEIELSQSEKMLWRRISPLLGPHRRPMTMHDIAAREKLELRVVKRILERAARAGHAVRISDGRFLHKSALMELALKVEALAASSKESLFDAAAFRDRSNLGRGISIELLEYFDRIGFTQRVGDQRRVIKGYWQNAGSARRA